MPNLNEGSGSGGKAAPKQLPQAPKGEASGMFAQPIKSYTISQYQPYYYVRIWSMGTSKDGVATEPFIADPNGVLHSFNEFVTSISTQHSIGDAAGQFSLGVLPVRFPFTTGNKETALRSWAEILKPMDYIEITLCRRVPPKEQRNIIESHSPTAPDDKIIRDMMLSMETAKDAPFVVIRGFLTNIRIVDAVDSASGKPTRRVMVNGMNFGKLWLNYRLFLLAEDNERIEPKYRNVFTSTKGNGISITPAQFMGTVYGAIFRPQLALLAKRIPQVLNHTVYCDVPSDGRYVVQLSKLVLDVSEGTLDSLMRKYAAKPFTELYTYDEGWPSGKPITTWRWAPYLDRQNRYPMADHVPVKSTIREMHAHEIQEHDIGNSDSDVITYYYAPPTAAMGTESYSKSSFPGYFDEAKYQIYGFRNFEPPWPWYNPGALDLAGEKRNSSFAGELERLNNWLASCYEHVVDNMEGQVSASARPDIHAGEYLDIPESGYRFYVESVSHQMIVGQSFTTNLTLTRGLPLADDPEWVLPKGYQYSNTDYSGKGTGKGGPKQDSEPFVAPRSDKDPNKRIDIPTVSPVDPRGT